MIGLAVGIDFSLFILFRYKEVRKRGLEPIEAIATAVGTAGSAVIFAGNSDDCGMWSITRRH